MGVSGVFANPPPRQRTRPEESMTRRVERPPTPTIPPLPVPTTTRFDHLCVHLDSGQTLHIRYCLPALGDIVWHLRQRR